MGNRLKRVSLYLQSLLCRKYQIDRHSVFAFDFILSSLVWILQEPNMDKETFTIVVFEPKVAVHLWVKDDLICKRFVISHSIEDFNLFFSVCNVTISSREILSRSGQTFGEIKSPSTLSGPSFCWFRLKPEQNQRVEIQIYRIKRLGRLNADSKK